MIFREKVHLVVRGIPKGKVLTYKQVAASAGSPLAFRAVGNILNRNYDLAIPCHRVIRSDGSSGGYNHGTEKKAKLLSVERSQQSTFRSGYLSVHSEHSYIRMNV